MSVVALIPARGGSKGVPKKNVRLLGGYPLIAFSVAAARRCHAIDRVIVSTDSSEIAEVAAAWGAEVPFLRPAELALDISPDSEFVLHALDWFRREEGNEPELLVHLRPTTPLRDPALVAEAVHAIVRRPDATSVRSAHELAESPHKVFEIRDGLFTGLFPDDPRPEYYNLPRQTFPPAYQPNGYVDVLRTSFVRQGRGLHGARMLAFVTPVAVEVDRPEDFEYLEFLIERKGHPLYDQLRAVAAGAPSLAVAAPPIKEARDGR